MVVMIVLTRVSVWLGLCTRVVLDSLFAIPPVGYFTPTLTTCVFTLVMTCVALVTVRVLCLVTRMSIGMLFRAWVPVCIVVWAEGCGAITLAEVITLSIISFVLRVVIVWWNGRLATFVTGVRNIGGLSVKGLRWTGLVATLVSLSYLGCL